jgi:hypothetical protein
MRSGNYRARAWGGGERDHPADPTYHGREGSRPRWCWVLSTPHAKNKQARRAKKTRGDVGGKKAKKVT